MPRKKLVFLPGKEKLAVDCFAFYTDKSGKPKCKALQDIYCLKEHTPCPFKATPQEAARSNLKARIRLFKAGRI